MGQWGLNGIMMELELELELELIMLDQIPKIYGLF
jgi:hypothetical protein